MGIGDLKINQKVLIDGQVHAYCGQDMVKIGLGKVSQYVFVNYNTGKKKFYNKTIKFVFEKTTCKIGLSMKTSY
jgi:hypothetical protein